MHFVCCRGAFVCLRACCATQSFASFVVSALQRYGLHVATLCALHAVHFPVHVAVLCCALCAAALHVACCLLQVCLWLACGLLAALLHVVLASLDGRIFAERHLVRGILHAAIRCMRLCMQGEFDAAASFNSLDSPCALAASGSPAAT